MKDLLLEAADHVDGINRRFEFDVLLTVPHLRMFWGIPRLLQGYVSLLDLAAKRLAGGAHFYRNLGKGILPCTSSSKRVGFETNKCPLFLRPSAIATNTTRGINATGEKSRRMCKDRPFDPNFHIRPSVPP